MKWTSLNKRQKEEIYVAKMEKWHKIFAWTPIRLTFQPTQKVWLEFMYRKGVRQGYHFERPIKFVWTYAESSFDVLAHDKAELEKGKR